MTFIEVSIALVVIVISVFTIVYAYFQWNYQYWKRKNLPHFEPRFPWGNLDVFNTDQPPGHDVVNLVEKAYKKGKLFMK